MSVIDLATRLETPAEKPDLREHWNDCADIYERAVVFGFKKDGDMCVTGLGDITVEACIYLIERGKIALLAAEEDCRRHHRRGLHLSHRARQDRPARS